MEVYFILYCTVKSRFNESQFNVKSQFKVQNFVTKIECLIKKSQFSVKSQFKKSKCAEVWPFVKSRLYCTFLQETGIPDHFGTLQSRYDFKSNPNKWSEAENAQEFMAIFTDRVLPAFLTLLLVLHGITILTFVNENFEILLGAIFTFNMTKNVIITKVKEIAVKAKADARRNKKLYVAWSCHAIWSLFCGIWFTVIVLFYGMNKHKNNFGQYNSHV